MNEGRFNLRGWESNHLTSTTPNKEDKEVSVLGLLWNLGRDTLRCVIPEVHCETMTKRTILSCTQRVFDPVGYTCPVTLYPKILLQELWSLKKGWDEPVPEEFQTKFEKCKKQLPLLGTIELPRFTHRDPDSQLHVFTDASQKAYAASVFLRTSSEEGITITLLRAKLRVVPIEKITIPRLELLA
ncbi:uncharacterized protein LOC123298961 [Chrysoperla carnea]|uniref:uncharacterized protein LOC123298961 n=1 Tax=Chrysoperla carnea TaxID=189513 RepID=UPI001D07E359|nr:uncharacterized protein LOC123298961 [Chrysoperla carnea]